MVDDYDVGYKKPPKTKQFKKGKSGNPGGRPKGSKNKKTFHPISKTSYEFQKMIVDMGEVEINVVKGGQIRSVSQMEALVMQLYNKAMKGDMTAAKILLEYTKRSMDELEEAAHRAHTVTKNMRAKERAEIFKPSPEPNTYGAFLERKHKMYSHNFSMRETFGPDMFPKIRDDEPDNEYQWAHFNQDMRKEYLECGDDEGWKDHILPNHSMYDL